MLSGYIRPWRHDDYDDLDERVLGRDKQALNGYF